MTTNAARILIVPGDESAAEYLAQKLNTANAKQREAGRAKHRAIDAAEVAMNEYRASDNDLSLWSAAQRAKEAIPALEEACTKADAERKACDQAIESHNRAMRAKTSL